MPGETSPSRSYMPENVPQGCGRKRGSRCGAKRRRSESNRRIEVLQTSALPLGYGAERNVRSQLTTSSARLGVRIALQESRVVVIMVAGPWGSLRRRRFDRNGYLIPRCVELRTAEFSLEGSSQFAEHFGFHLVEHAGPR